MTLTDILAHAVSALTLVQSLPLGDPRIALALQVIGGSLAVVQSLDQRGMFGHDPIEVDDIGQIALASLQRQLNELGEEAL